MAYTEQEIISALQEAADILGEDPSIKQYNSLDISPSSRTIRDNLGWNKAKELAGLKTSESSRVNKQQTPKVLNITDTEWQNLSKHERKLKRKRAKYTEIQLERGCNKCGYAENPAALEWHHLRDKEWSISTMINRTLSDEKIDAEIEKCVVMCANCHKVETWGNKYDT